MQDLFAKLMQNQSFLFEKDVKSCFAQKKKKAFFSQPVPSTNYGLNRYTIFWDLLLVKKIFVMKKIKIHVEIPFDFSCSQRLISIVLSYLSFVSKCVSLFASAEARI